MNPHRFSSHLNKSKSTAVAAGPSHVTQAKAAAPDTRSLRELLESHDEAALRRGLTQLPEGECTPGDLSATAEKRLLDALPHACISSLHVGLMHNPDRYFRSMQSSAVRVWDCCHARVATRDASPEDFPNSAQVDELVRCVLSRAHVNMGPQEIRIKASRLDKAQLDKLRPFCANPPGGPASQRLGQARVLVLCDDAGVPLPIPPASLDAEFEEKLGQACAKLRSAPDGAHILDACDDQRGTELQLWLKALEKEPLRELRVRTLHQSTQLFRALPRLQTSRLDLVDFNDVSKSNFADPQWSEREFRDMLKFLNAPPGLPSQAPYKELVLLKSWLSAEQEQQLKADFEWTEAPWRQGGGDTEITLRRSFGAAQRVHEPQTRPQTLQAEATPQTVSQVDMAAIQQGFESFIQRGFAREAIGLLKDPDNKLRPFLRSELDGLRRIAIRHSTDPDATVQQAALEALEFIAASAAQ